MAEIKETFRWGDDTDQTFDIKTSSPGPSSFSVTSEENNSLLGQRSKTLLIRTTNRSPQKTGILTVIQLSAEITYELLFIIDTSEDIGPEGGLKETESYLISYRRGVEVQRIAVDAVLEIDGEGFYISGSSIGAVNRERDDGARRSCDIAASYVSPDGVTLIQRAVIWQGSNFKEDSEWVSLVMNVEHSIDNPYYFPASGGTYNIIDNEIQSVIENFIWPSGYVDNEDVKDELDYTIFAIDLGFLSFVGDGKSVSCGENHSSSEQGPSYVYIESSERHGHDSTGTVVFRQSSGEDFYLRVTPFEEITATWRNNSAYTLTIESNVEGTITIEEAD